MSQPDLTAHLLTEDGVTPVRFRRTNPTTWTNVEPVSMRNGDVLDLGSGISIQLGDLASRSQPEDFQLPDGGLQLP